MKKRNKYILIISIVVLLLLMALYPFLKKTFFSNQDNNPQTSAQSSSDRNKPLNVNIKCLEYETLNDIFRTKGILIPDEEVDLSFETSGKITRIYFQEGSFVKKGDLLAKVNDAPLQAELKKLEAQIPLAKDRVFRQKSLLEKDAVSQESYEAVATELEKLQADLEFVKARINQTELRAPFDGTIGLRFVSEGTYASPSLVIARLTKISPLKIEFSVNERQANEVNQGTNLIFSIENDTTRYQAKVYAVESKLDPQTLALKVRALYPNASRKLKPGHSATVEINLQEIKNALVVPSISVIAEMGRDFVYVYKNGKAEQVTVKKGMRTASSVQIIEGLQAGDTLITSGVMQLRSGMDVIINQ